MALTCSVNPIENLTDEQLACTRYTPHPLDTQQPSNKAFRSLQNQVYVIPP